MLHADAVIAYVLMCGVFVTAAVWDYRSEKIPNGLTVSGFFGGLIYWTVADAILHGTPLAGLTASFLAFLAGFVPLLIIRLFKGCGGGDVKLLGAVGAICGNYEAVFRILVLGAFTVAIYAVIVMIVEGRVKQTFKRIFGALMMAAASVDPELDKNTRRIPVAVPFCIAGIVAGAESMLGFRIIPL